MCSFGATCADIWGPLGVVGGLWGGPGRLGGAWGSSNCEILIFAKQTKAPGTNYTSPRRVQGGCEEAIRELGGSLGRHLLSPQSGTRLAPVREYRHQKQDIVSIGRI